MLVHAQAPARRAPAYTLAVDDLRARRSGRIGRLHARAKAGVAQVLLIAPSDSATRSG